MRWRALTPSAVFAMRARSMLISDTDGRDAQVMHRRCMLNDLEKRVLYAPSWRAAIPDEDTIPWLRARIPRYAGDRVLQRQLHDIDTMLHDEMTAKLDRGTMACGIEGRSPFLDYRIVEMATSLPLHLRYSNGTGKSLLRAVARRYLPAEIVSRPKCGFTIPLDSLAAERATRNAARHAVSRCCPTDRCLRSESHVRAAGILLPQTELPDRSHGLHGSLLSVVVR